MKLCNETIVITDPCYLKHSSPLIRRGTGYGDWSCMVYPGKLGENKDPEVWDNYYFKFFTNYNIVGRSSEEQEALRKEHEVFKEAWIANHTLGEFCADAGEVGVFNYDLLSPLDKLWIFRHPWCACIIENFTGDVEIEVSEDKSVHVVGSGEKPFFSIQSGF